MVARSIIHNFGGHPVFVFDIGGFNEPLRVVRFSGSEGLSTLFELQVELACENQEVDFAQVVGKSALLAIRGEDGWRYLNGIVSHFEQLNELPRYAIYRATVVPLVWKLLHRYDCRIFQKLDTPAILKKVFEAAGVPSDRVSFKLSSNYEPRDYCVQYRESDWTFVSRLMEEDGIFYFFEHFEDKHMLVIGDGKPALKPIEGTELLPFRRNMGTVVLEDHIHRFRFTQEVRSGKATLRDYKFKQPDLDMEADKAEEVDADLEVYDYPGEYQDPSQGSTAKGKTIAQVRLESFQATRRVAQGESDCERLVPGRLFTLAEHSRGDYNGRYLLTAVSHQGSQPQVLDEESQGGEFSYSNHFSCIPEKVPYRPARVTPRPYVKGGQTAVVVGPAGEEIYVDEWGRVKVQFHWDRQGKLDENSSCWIRVSQLWAGELWGRMFIPRIGQEVIVDFIEGDPDRPIITGRVYNGANIVPYELPAEKTKSTLKSNSSMGKEGYNELRYEDKKGQEQFFMHAERNMDVHVKNDSFENILHDRHQTIGSEGKNGKVGDQNEMVFRDKSLTVHRHSQEHIGGDFKRLVGGVDGEGNVDIVIKADRKELVHKDSHLHVKQNLNEQVDVTQSLEVGKDLHVVVGQVEALEAGKELHLKSSKIVIEAAEGLTWKGPGGFITISSGGIAIKGNLVLINAGGSALSGSGVSPTAPQDAAEAQPTKPTLADDGMVRPPSDLEKAQGGKPPAPAKPMALAATSLPPSLLPSPPVAAASKGAAKARGVRKAQNGVHCNGGHPVDVITGVNFDEFMDARSGPPGLFCWRRYYTTARADRNGPLGWGFRHEYQHVLHLGSEEWLYEDPKGREVDFTPLREGELETVSQGVVLRRAGPGRFELREGSQPVRVLEVEPGGAQARLVQVYTQGARLELRYEGERLVEVLERTAKGTCHYQLRYESRGYVSEVVRELPGSDSQRVAAYEYDEVGNQVVACNAEGGRYEYEYDEAHRWTRMRDPNGYAFWWRYDEQGRCVETAGEDGLWWTRLEYEPDKRLTRVTERGGGVSTFHYDENRTLRRRVDPYGGVLVREVGGDGRVLREVDSGGRITDMVYDDYGALVGRVDPYRRTLPTPEEMPKPPPPERHFHASTRLGYLLGSLWDTLPEALLGAREVLLQRVPGEFAPLVAMLVRRRQPGVEQVPPPELTYGGLGQVVKEVDAAGRERVLGYDKAGNVVWRRDADGKLRQWKVGRWNLVVKEVDGLGHATHYSYSSTEQVVQVVDPGGTSSEYDYDEKDRLVRVHRHGEVREEYTWDTGDRLVEKKDGRGQWLLRIENGPWGRTATRHLASGGRHLLEWDERDRPRRASTDRYEVVMARGADGHMLHDLRNDRGLEHVRTARGWRTTLLRHLTWWVEEDETGEGLVVVDPTGQQHHVWRDRTGLVLREHSNGSSELSHYTDTGRLRSTLAWRREVGGAQQPRWARYETTPEGNLVAVQHWQYGEAHYTLDAAHRLVEERQGQEHRAYRLDSAGNLLEKPGLWGVELASGNRLAQANGEEFTYNSRNHVSERRSPGKPPARYTYDSMDMLVRVEDGQGEPWTAEYDALCRRVRCGRGMRQTEFYWDGDRLAAEVSPEGRLRVYVYAAHDSLVPLLLVDYATVNSLPESGRVYILYTNQAGVPTHVEDSSGRVVWWAERIEPYGQVHVHPDSEVELHLRWPGHYLDRDTGLYYNRYRYYDPVLGRYLQSDPLGLAGGLNLYAYAPNPLVQVDVLGLHAQRAQSHNAGSVQGKEDLPEPRASAASTPLPPEPASAPVSPLPKELKSPKPNTTYEVNGYTYKTDSQGRIVQVSGKLRLDPAARNKYAQRQVGKLVNDKGDDGGHLIGSRFGGSGEKINMVPQDSNLNRGAWNQMEKSWAEAIAAGQEVEVKIIPVYSGDSPRPTKFEVIQVINGKETKQFFKNQPRG